MKCPHCKARIKIETVREWIKEMSREQKQSLRGSIALRLQFDPPYPVCKLHESDFDGNAYRGTCPHCHKQLSFTAMKSVILRFPVNTWRSLLGSISSQLRLTIGKRPRSNKPKCHCGSQTMKRAIARNCACLSWSKAKQKEAIADRATR